MSYGTDRRHASKKELREDIAARGADRVGVFGTSAFGNETGASVADLPAGTVIVGPDPYTSRKWYAAVVRKADGTITVK